MIYIDAANVFRTNSSILWRKHIVGRPSYFGLLTIF